MIVKQCTEHDLMCEWVKARLSNFLGEMLIEAMETKIDKLPRSKHPDMKYELEKLRRNLASVFGSTPEDENVRKEYKLVDGNRENEPSYKIHKDLCYLLRDKWYENSDEFIEQMKRQYSENNITLVITD